jgi:two-component system nitrogen regulation response regulator GlnG/two-component system response regulator HydG
MAVIVGVPDTSGDFELPWGKSRARPVKRVPCLVMAWSLDEPDRIGEAIVVARTVSVGRGGALPDDPAPRTSPYRMRPGSSELCGPIANARVSRTHLVLVPIDEESLTVRTLGRATVRINGKALASEAVARTGDIIEIHNAALFVVAARPTELPAAGGAPHEFAYGRPDPFGIVGESELAWKLREQLAFAASTDRHVLVLGESGAGKELAARALHGLSARRDRPFVARNAATMPDSLIDAELFGNVKNYPNPGMPERPGLVGEADGSTLFLDEIGDLPEKCQVHLLRVLDADGEYQRLGEARTLKSAFRLVAATNRAPDTLKHDFLARFTHRIVLPGLHERRDDIPLVLAEILRRTASKHRAIADRFFERRLGVLAEPRLSPDLVVRLLRHPFTHHVRELERLMWLGIGTAESDFIGLTPAVEAELRDSAESETESSETTEIDRETLARALADHGRSPTRAAKALGLKNRFVLLRLLKKHGLSVGAEDGETP